MQQGEGLRIQSSSDYYHPDQPVVQPAIQAHSQQQHQQQTKEPSSTETNCAVAIFIIIGMLWGAAFMVYLMVALIHVQNPDSEKSVGFSFLCLGNMPEDYCFIAIGQFTYGFISIGQMAFGIINISQCGIGLLLAIGQFQISYGVAMGQFAFATLVPLAQFGFAIRRVYYAMIGVQLMPFMKRNGDLFVSCCRVRRHSNYNTQSQDYYAPPAQTQAYTYQ